MSNRPPLWGNFVAFADEDLLAFGALMQGGLWILAMYHITQAVEKYLKALALSIVDPTGTSATPKNQKWVMTHDLTKLAIRCASVYPYYANAAVQNNLKRFTEFDQAARYPWVTQQHGTFTTADIPIFEDILYRLRNDLPIERDDYPLGMLVRGHHHGHPNKKMNPYWEGLHRPALLSLRSLIKNVDGLVRK